MEVWEQIANEFESKPGEPEELQVEKMAKEIAALRQGLIPRDSAYKCFSCGEMSLNRHGAKMMDQVEDLSGRLSLLQAKYDDQSATLNREVTGRIAERAALQQVRTCIEQDLQSRYFYDVVLDALEQAPPEVVENTSPDDVIVKWGQFRKLIQNSLWKTGILSNPGWSDSNVTDAVEQVCLELIQTRKAVVKMADRHDSHKESANEWASRAKALRAAIRPLVLVWERYLDDGLDEARPAWGDGEDKDVTLLSGRGGRTLISLQDAKKAHEASLV